MSANQYNWKIFNATMLISAINFFAKLFSAVKELFVAAVFGTGVAVDGFILASLIPLLSVHILSVPYAASLVPSITRLRVNGEPRSAHRLFEIYLVVALAVLTILSILLFLLADPVATLLTPEAGSLREVTSDSLRILAPLVAVAGISQIITLMLNAFERFSLPSFAQLFPPLGIIIALAFDSSLSPTLIAWGALYGSIAQLVLLIGYYQITRLRSSGSESNQPLPLDFSSLWLNWAALFASALLMSSADIIDQVMAAQLGAGEVARLSYGTKVVALLISVFAGALGSAAFPYISQMIERKEDHLLQQTLRTYLRLLWVGSMITIGLVVLLSTPIITILFERGAFTAGDTAQVAFVQQLGVLQLPFYLMNTLYMRVVMGRQLLGMLTKVTVVSIILNIILNWIFSGYFGVAGIALSTSCVYCWSALALYRNCQVKSQPD